MSEDSGHSVSVASEYCSRQAVVEPSLSAAGIS